MHCFDARRFIPTYVDGEFDERDRSDFEAHLRSCRDCRTSARFEDWFLRGLRESIPSPPAPAHLRSRIEAQLDEVSLPLGERLAAWFPRPARMAVPVAAAAAVAALLVLLPGSEPPATCTHPVEEAVAVHSRYLPVEVSGGDPQEVGRWFWGKVDFPVRPPALPDALPASFVGARLSHVGHSPAAHFIYDLDGSRVSVLEFQWTDVDLPEADVMHVGPHRVHVDRRNGYNVAFVRDQDVTWAVTGDLDPATMVRFVSGGLR